MKKLTKEQAAVIGAYTGYLVGPFSDVHEYAERILGRQIFTHQMPRFEEQIREAAKADFVSMAYEDEK